MHGRRDGAGKLALIHEPGQQARGDRESHSGKVGPAGVLRVPGIRMPLACPVPAVCCSSFSLCP